MCTTLNFQYKKLFITTRQLIRIGMLGLLNTVSLCLAEDGARFLRLQKPFTQERIYADTKDLSLTAHTILENLIPEKNPRLFGFANSKIFRDKEAYLRHTRHTLSFLENNIKGGLLTPEFLNKHFHVVKWEGDRENAAKHNKKVAAGHIHLTKYVVYKEHGSPHKTEEFPHALYAIPHDEDGLSTPEVEADKGRFLRFQYSKQDIVNGAFERPELQAKLTPLVWLSRYGLEEALMQGTIVVELPDHSVRVYNIMKNNRMAYDRSKKPFYQDSYGYFKEVGRFKNDTEDVSSAFTMRPGSTFAGDISNIGLGQLVAIRYTNPTTKQKELRVGILADTGGAFRNNMYQLDYFVGIFKSRKEFYAYNKSIPDDVEAFILVKK